MSQVIKQLQERAISPRSVRSDGHLTSPRTFGVYELPAGVQNVRRFRFGNHPVRLRELEQEYGACKLLYLFEAREDAAAMAKACNGL